MRLGYSRKGKISALVFSSFNEAEAHAPRIREQVFASFLAQLKLQ